MELGQALDSQSSTSETNFRVNSMTGDLILFKSKNSGAKFQRRLTKSDYDHVGIIIRGMNNASEVVFLEAVNQEGRLLLP